MPTIRGCNIPEDLYYNLEKHVWAKPMDGGVVRVGMTQVAGKLAGGKLTAVTIKAKNIGQEVKQGKSAATVESSKYVGPVPAPITGTLLRANDKLVGDPNLPVTDPYGEGWIVELQASNWDAEKDTLVTGPAGVAAYQAKLDAEGISC
ncbi:MAG: glycine cleavage system protein H [Chloroflexales bacterium]|nr:glycine cleavage system protein H [Chloroflexales bacterium]